MIWVGGSVVRTSILDRSRPLFMAAGLSLIVAVAFVRFPVPILALILAGLAALGAAFRPTFLALGYLAVLPLLLTFGTQSTCVIARSVLIGGMPLTSREKSATAFSTVMRMITVLAAVICGWTSRVSAASRNVTVTVLFATV